MQMLNCGESRGLLAEWMCIRLKYEQCTEQSGVPAMGLLWPLSPHITSKANRLETFACPDSVGWDPQTLKSISLGIKNRKGITVLHTELEGEKKL